MPLPRWSASYSLTLASTHLRQYFSRDIVVVDDGLVDEQATQFALDEIMMRRLGSVLDQRRAITLVGGTV
jgi:hypothetical protein